VAVVECKPADAAAWRQRLEARGARLAAAGLGHKPATWADLQALIARSAPPQSMPSSHVHVCLIAQAGQLQAGCRWQVPGLRRLARQRGRPGAPPRPGHHVSLGRRAGRGRRPLAGRPRAVRGAFVMVIVADFVTECAEAHHAVFTLSSAPAALVPVHQACCVRTAQARNKCQVPCVLSTTSRPSSVSRTGGQ